MNKEVQARIETCQKEKAQELDLSGLGLTKIPKAVGELVWLRRLDLSNNQIQTIQGLDQLSNITHLFLSNNQIQAIQGLDQLSNITTLALQNNQIQAI
ncbi:MAG: leucine-rich repeat protein, partial [Aureispira sp.]